MREGAAVPWILAAHMLVHTNCTTGVEAVALDKPSICVVSLDNPANRRYLANVVNPVTTTVAADDPRDRARPGRSAALLQRQHDRLLPR